MRLGGGNRGTPSKKEKSSKMSEKKKNDTDGTPETSSGIIRGHQLSSPGEERGRHSARNMRERLHTDKGKPDRTSRRG